MSTDKGKLEEENRRYSLAHRCTESLLKEGFDIDVEHKALEKKWMDVLLKMFALATRSDREYRALNVAELMPNPVIVQGAIRYATQRHRIALAERLGEVMNKKLLKDVVEEDDDEDFYLPECDDASESLIPKNVSTPNLPKEDSILRPKPLSRIRSHVAKSSESFEEHENSDVRASEVLSSSISLLTPKTPHTNPFKSHVKEQAKKEDMGNTSGIDDMLNNSMKSLASKNCTSSEMGPQPKKSRFQTKKESIPKTSNGAGSEKEKFGFDLYVEQNRETIRESASPDTDDKEIIKMAMKLYKELSKSEKQKYQKSTTSHNLKGGFFTKAKNAEDDSDVKENSFEVQTNSPSELAGKRKGDDSEDTILKPKKLKPSQDKLSDTTVRKLTQFAFTKAPK